MIAHNGTHRVFLVDDRGRAVGVISFKDALIAIIRLSERGKWLQQDPLMRPVSGDGANPLDLCRADSTADLASKVASLCNVKLTRVDGSPGSSGILTNAAFHLPHLWMNLPAKLRHHDWRLLYQLEEDGASLRTLMHHCSVTREPCITMIQDTRGRKFGTVTLEPWRVQSEIHGSGEAFVWAFLPAPFESLEVFHWTGQNTVFQHSFEDSISIGGGGDGAAIYIDHALKNGASYASETYGNECLASGESFVVHKLEVWGLGWKPLASFPSDVRSRSGTATSTGTPR